MNELLSMDSDQDLCYTNEKKIVYNNEKSERRRCLAKPIFYPESQVTEYEYLKASGILMTAYAANVEIRTNNNYHSNYYSLNKFNKHDYLGEYHIDHLFTESNYNISYKVTDFEYEIPIQLKKIIDEIERSRYILDLEDDWDDEGAIATNIETFNKAIKFILDYSLHIFKIGKLIETPKIDILRDGSVSVNWETHKASFLIIFKITNAKYSYYYGETKIDNIPFKLAISNGNKNIDEITALWMSENLA
jgi:hypothetical protein